GLFPDMGKTVLAGDGSLCGYAHLALLLLLRTHRKKRRSQQKCCALILQLEASALAGGENLGETSVDRHRLEATQPLLVVTHHFRRRAAELDIDDHVGRQANAGGHRRERDAELLAASAQVGKGGSAGHSERGCAFTRRSFNRLCVCEPIATIAVESSW